MGADFLDALRLLAGGDADAWQVALVSLQVSAAAVLAATIVGIPLAYLLSQARPRVARLAISLSHAATAVPTVVVGLTLYFVISASGPLGWMHLLYTRLAMVGGQFLLALPVITAVCLVSLTHQPKELAETVQTLAVPPLRRMRLILGEVRPALTSAVLLAFARVFTELGAAIILGGNIRGETRTLTTMIALEYDRGDGARVMASGILLIVVALAVNAFAHRGAATQS
jgi:tungstate transport system permease protein